MKLRDYLKDRDFPVVQVARLSGELLSNYPIPFEGRGWDECCEFVADHLLDLEGEVGHLTRFWRWCNPNGHSLIGGIPLTSVAAFSDQEAWEREIREYQESQ